jgi:hypothetical protein
MEVFRDLGIEERVRAVATPLRMLGHNVLATTFSGLEIARPKAACAADVFGARTWRASWVRDVTSSLRKTLRRW